MRDINVYYKCEIQTKRINNELTRTQGLGTRCCARATVSVCTSLGARGGGVIQEGGERHRPISVVHYLWLEECVVSAEVVISLCIRVQRHRCLERDFRHMHSCSGRYHGARG